MIKKAFTLVALLGVLGSGCVKHSICSNQPTYVQSELKALAKYGNLDGDNTISEDERHKFIGEVIKSNGAKYIEASLVENLAHNLTNNLIYKDVTITEEALGRKICEYELGRFYVLDNEGNLVDCEKMTEWLNNFERKRKFRGAASPTPPDPYTVTPIKSIPMLKQKQTTEVKK